MEYDELCKRLENDPEVFAFVNHLHSEKNEHKRQQDIADAESSLKITSLEACIVELKRQQDIADAESSLKIISLEVCIVELKRQQDIADAESSLKITSLEACCT
ncbi:MAG: hypothetical protein U9N40_07550 [Euryarchaeota archaeon]|nr:hypothetical protein [Euryarchaeota archaeon]